MKSLAQQLEPIFDQIAKEQGGLRAQLTTLAGEFERYAILRLLEQTLGNVAEASRLAGTSRRNFINLMDKHSIDASNYYVWIYGVNVGIHPNAKARITNHNL